MKRISILFLSFFLFLGINEFKASHTLGGEISWFCDANGNYIFEMKFYRDCSGISWGYGEETISIFGSPLPTNAFGNPINSILLRPDSARFEINNNGDMSPKCDPLLGNQLQCPNQNNTAANGIIQVFYYRSDPIQLSGKPGPTGWVFRWESACCRPGNMENVNTPGPLILKAAMFRLPGAASDSCRDNSPDFRALPSSVVCRGNEFTYNPAAIDRDLDSLVYRWGRPTGPPIEAPVFLEYKTGYTFNNPTPDKTFDIDNTPATLNPLTGVTEFKIVNGGGVLKYLLVFRVDSYREGQRIASIWREFPISVFNCSKFPNNTTNTVPIVKVDGIDTRDALIEAVAGQELRQGIQVTDNDITGVGTQIQTITVVPDGLLFSTNRSSSFPCQVAGKDLSPCAFLQKSTPFLDQTVSPPVYKLEGLGGVATEFVWQTDCKHVSRTTGKPGTNSGIYSFVFRVSDDNCPIPNINYPSITVRVRDPFPLTEPIMKGASVTLDGYLKYQWVPPLDSAFTFDKYVVEQVETNEGNAPLPNFWINLEEKLRRYKKEFNFNNNLYFTPQPANPLLPNILRKKANKDWYVRMTTESGCKDTVQSVPSQPVRVIETDVQPSGNPPLLPERARATITWNRPKPVNADSKPYFHYESPTHFYIWENDSVSNGGVAVKDNWYLRGDTNATTYSFNSNVCGDFAAFRIEARDTVITWKEGNPPRTNLDSLDTLIFSTFSIIDTLFMVTPGFIPAPKFDTVEVRANGDVYFRVDAGNSGTIGSFRIYASEVNPDSLLASFDLKDQDSILIPNQGAGGSERNYVLEGIDECNPSITKSSFVYETFIPSGGLIQPVCSSIYRLQWRNPGGFPQGTAGYRIYQDTVGNGNFELIQTINDPNTTTADIPVRKDRTYEFQVVAFDQENAVIMSAIIPFAPPSDLRSFEIVPPPQFRCTYVEDNGEVTVTWLKRTADEDTTGNFNEYRFEYRLNGGAWTQFPPGNLVTWEDTTLRITGINAQNGRYDIRARVLSGCSGFEPSEWSQISTIDVNAEAIPNSVNKDGEIEWNSTGVASSNDYSIYKDTFGLTYDNNLLNPFVSQEDFLDDTNGPICDGVFNYYVTREDEFSGCVNRSNIDSTRYIDLLPPNPIELDYISYNLITGDLEAHWSDPNPGDVDSLFFITTDGFNSGLQAFRELVEERWGINPQEVTIPRSILDARDTSVVVGAITQDACDNRSAESDVAFHRSMDVEVQWNVCDSAMEVSWNPYEGFNTESEIVYTVYRRETGNPTWSEVPGSATTDTFFVNQVDQADLRYFYHVRATPADSAFSDFVSNSNIDSDTAIFVSIPRFGYLRYVTVLPSNEIEMEFNRDTLINVKGYNIFKGEDKEFLNPIAFIDARDVEDNENFQYIDPDVDVNGISYYYKVVTQSACDEPVDTSNFGRSILLKVRPNHEALTNKLVWNGYEEWDSTVSFYNVYRGIDQGPTNRVHSVVAPSELDSTTFIDDVYDEIFSIGEFCYVVEAVQGPVSNQATNGFPNNLNSAKSRSNIVCVTQEPLFYVPNAFAPDGVNKMFAPKGQFLDFSRYEMVIYNRWGEELFRTRDINQGWDGTYNGELVQLGSYVYMIRFVDADGQEHRRKGTVTVVR